MRKLGLLVVTGFILFALSLSWTTPARADEGADCEVDPPSGPIGTGFEIECDGFTPNTHVYSYVVEPGGAARPLIECGSAGDGRFECESNSAGKTDEDGGLDFDFETKIHEGEFSAAVALGDWAIVVEQLGLKHTVVKRAIARFTVKGGTEGVSGASIHAEPDVLYKETAHDHPPLEITNGTGSGTSNEFGFVETELNGEGFAPNEIVTVWGEQPGGGCNSQTLHGDAAQRATVFGRGTINQVQQYNVPIFDGFSAFFFGNLKADGKGAISGDFRFFSFDCEGEWHLVARGNTSGRGGDTVLTLLGNPIGGGATLTASSDSVNALFGRISFHGSGFNPGERVSCWTTSPQGQVLAYPEDYPKTFSVNFGAQSLSVKTQLLNADTAGELNFGLVTGSEYIKTTTTSVIDGVPSSSTTESFDPIASEGAVGEWAMTCRGDESGSTGSTRYVVYSGVIDP